MSDSGADLRSRLRREAEDFDISPTMPRRTLRRARRRQAAAVVVAGGLAAVVVAVATFAMSPSRPTDVADRRGGTVPMTLEVVTDGRHEGERWFLLRGRMGDRPCVLLDIGGEQTECLDDEDVVLSAIPGYLDEHELAFVVGSTERAITSVTVATSDGDSVRLPLYDDGDRRYFASFFEDEPVAGLIYARDDRGIVSMQRFEVSHEGHTTTAGVAQAALSPLLPGFFALPGDKAVVEAGIVAGQEYGVGLAGGDRRVCFQIEGNGGCMRSGSVRGILDLATVSTGRWTLVGGITSAQVSRLRIVVDGEAPRALPLRPAPGGFGPVTGYFAVALPGDPRGTIVALDRSSRAVDEARF